MKDDLSRTSPLGVDIVRSLRATEAKVEQVKGPGVDRDYSKKLLGGIGTTNHCELEEVGKVKSFLIGEKWVILVSSIFDYLVAEAIRSHPLNAPPLKAERPVHKQLRERRELLRERAAAGV